MKLLFGIPSPFDFPLVLKYQKTITEDKIIPHYYNELKAYKIIRDYFLSHKEYTHLAFACSDVVVKQGHLELIKNDLSITDWQVMSGMMNICLDKMGVYNITDNVVWYKQPEFNWYTDKTIPGEWFQVKFSGFPLMCMSRDVVERFAFEAVRSTTMGSLDVLLCWRLHESSIPIYCDKRINLLHLKELCEQSQPLMVGVKPAYTEVWQNGKCTTLDV